jgi:hypothetical protein
MKPLPTSSGVFYHPPKSSSFGHASVPREPGQGWQHTLAFLDALSVSCLRPKLELRIRCYPQWSDVKLIEKCIAEATEQFGDPTGSDDSLGKSWNLPSHLLGEAVNFALGDMKRTPQEIGPTWLHMSYDFWWRPHAALPNVERPGEGSYLGVFHGGRRLFLQPTFRFPFEEATADFRAFVAHVQSHLPFKFREANFRVMLPSVGGKTPRVRKLSPGWLAA